MRTHVSRYSERWTREYWRVDALSQVLSALAALRPAGWAVFFHAGLVLSHYDAKAHLVVRRASSIISRRMAGRSARCGSAAPSHRASRRRAIFLPHRAFASLVSIGCLAVTIGAAAGDSASHRLAPGAASARRSSRSIPTCSIFTRTMNEPLLLAASMLVILWWSNGWTRIATRAGEAGAGAVRAAWTRYEVGGDQRRAGRGGFATCGAALDSRRDA